MRLRIVQCMIDFVRCTKFDSYQTRSPPFGRLKVSKGDAGGMAGEEREGYGLLRPIAGDREIGTPLVNGTHKLPNVVGCEVPQRDVDMFFLSALPGIDRNPIQGPLHTHTTL